MTETIQKRKRNRAEMNEYGWRLWVLELVARIVGIRFKLNGLPYGSRRVTNSEQGLSTNHYNQSFD